MEEMRECSNKKRQEILFMESIITTVNSTSTSEIPKAKMIEVVNWGLSGKGWPGHFSMNKETFISTFNILWIYAILFMALSQFMIAFLSIVVSICSMSPHVKERHALLFASGCVHLLFF